MTTFTRHEPGTFSYIELATKDTAAAKAFYSGLFGWTYDDVPIPGMLYTMVKLDGKTVGAMYGLDPKHHGDMPTHWATYVTVIDVDTTTKKVTGAGGKVIKEPFDVMDAGRMSVVADPDGGMLCLWQARRNPGAEIKDAPGSLCWVELYANNVDRDGKFWLDVLGWKTQSHDMGPAGVYTLFKTSADQQAGVGGMMAKPPYMPGPSFWLPYLATDDVDASAKKVKDLGGKVKVDATDIPNIGRFAIVEDPTGASFALYKNAH